MNKAQLKAYGLWSESATTTKTHLIFRFFCVIQYTDKIARSRFFIGGGELTYI